MVSARTLRMLRYIAECGEVPLHVLLRAFWPERATEEALPELRTWVHRQQRAGNVAQAVPRALDSVVKLSPQGARIFEERVHSGSVGHPRARAHHAATLLFVERIKEQLGPNQQLASVTLEPELRSEAQRGVGSKKGQSYDSFPDAVVVIREMMPDGTISSKRVAVEYVTSKYTSKDITEKAVSFAAAYDGVLWAADNPRTKQRVELLVGEACACLT